VKASQPMVPTIMAAAIPIRKVFPEIFILIFNDTGVNVRGQPLQHFQIDWNGCPTFAAASSRLRWDIYNECFLQFFIVFYSFSFSSHKTPATKLRAPSFPRLLRKGWGTNPLYKTAKMRYLQKSPNALIPEPMRRD
jgi:hypothetical protein